MPRILLENTILDTVENKFLTCMEIGDIICVVKGYYSHACEKPARTSIAVVCRRLTHEGKVIRMKSKGSKSYKYISSRFHLTLIHKFSLQIVEKETEIEEHQSVIKDATNKPVI